MQKAWAMILATCISALCGWGYLHLVTPLEILGLPGGLAYFAISQTGPEDGIAKLLLEALNVIVNTVFYYFLIRCIQRWRERRSLG